MKKQPFFFLAAAVVFCGMNVSAQQIKVTNDGKVGIGITAPSELVHINGGALKIGNATSPGDRAVNLLKFGDASYDFNGIGGV